MDGEKGSKGGLEHNVKFGSGIRLGVVGAGKIAPHHLKAAAANGFILEAICARDNSKSAQRLGAEFGFNGTCNTLQEFLTQRVDAYLLLTETGVQTSIARKLLKNGVPILIEKPVSLESHEIRSLREEDNKNRIVVGYNRRNLSSVKSIKSNLENLDYGTFFVNVPELSSSPNPSPQDIRNMILENSVHVFDLAFYIFGQPSSWEIHKVDLNSSMFSSTVQLQYEDGRSGTILLTLGVPDNWAISVYAPGHRLVLSPLEAFNHFDAIESIAATKERPNKLYSPKASKEWSPELEDTVFKAGFYFQMRDFRDFILSNRRSEALASLSEAEFVTSFAESIIESD